MKPYLKVLLNLKFIFWFYILLTLLASIHKYVVEPPQNFVIFKFGFLNLIHDLDIYHLYPNQGNNLFKYSPAFALILAPFMWMPNYIGGTLLNLTSALILLVSLRKLKIDDVKKALLLWFIFLEFLTSIQNFQLNVLIVALMIFTYTFIEEEKPLLSSFVLIFSVFIKIFSLATAAIYIFYPQKRKVILYSLLWASIFAVLPLLVISPNQLIFLYKSWAHVLANDVVISAGLSLISILYNWFDVKTHKIYIQLMGLIILLIPLIRISEGFFKETSKRLLFTASIFIWIIIFNHKAESPSYIIAIIGVAIWYSQSNNSKLNILLMIVTLLFTSIAPTDIVPKSIRIEYFEQYNIKPVACILVWFKLQFCLWQGWHPLELLQKSSRKLR